MADLLHYDSGSGYTVVAESSDVPAVRVGHLTDLPDPAGALAPLRHAQERWLDHVPYEVRWTQTVDRGGLSATLVKNTRVRCAVFGTLGGARTLTPSAAVLSWTAPAAGGRVESPPSDPGDILYAVDLWYGPRSSTAWRPRRAALTSLGASLSDAAVGDVLLVTRRGVWEFAVRLT